MRAIVNLIDHDMAPREVVEAPRCWTMGPVLELEEMLDGLPALLAGLGRRGHAVEVPAKIGGGMGAIHLDPKSRHLTGAACWRAGGDSRPVDVAHSRECRASV